MKTIKNLASLAVMVLLITGVSVPAHADLITVDQILYKLNPVGGLTPEQAANLSATVNMTYATVPSSTNILLTVTLTNTSGNTTGTTPNASNLLTGIGFKLPPGVSVVDNATYNSTVAIASGSTLFNDPDGLLSQNDWGWRGNNTGGHFSLAGVLPVDLILSTSSADVLQTFGGGARNLVDGTDYGLFHVQANRSDM